jgi:hypothetical protein
VSLQTCPPITLPLRAATGVAELRASAQSAEEAPPPAANKPPKPPLDDDDDIFEGAGRQYTLEVPDRPGGRPSGNGVKAEERGSYFAEPGKEAPQPEDALLPPPPPPPDAGGFPPQYGDALPPPPGGEYGPQAPPVGGGYEGMAYPEAAPDYYQHYPPAQMYPQAAGGCRRFLCGPECLCNQAHATNVAIVAAQTIVWIMSG